MRIDSFSFFNAGLSGMLNNQSVMARLNQQIATGQALLAPKDDPMAMAKIMSLTENVAQRTKYTANQTKADITLNYESTALSQISTTLHSIRDALAQASPNYDTQTRTSQTRLLAGLFSQLQDIGNSQDSSGNYIFSGDKTTTAPFFNAGGGSVPATVPITGAATTFNGNTTVHSVEIDAGRQLQVSDNLNAVFQAGVAGSDVLKTIDEAVQRLQLNSPNASAVTQQATIDGYVQVINAAISNLSLIQYRVAGAQAELANVKQSTQALQTQDQNSLASLTQVDQAQAITELQARQTTLSAAYSAYSKTSGLSLFKYL